MPEHYQNKFLPHCTPCHVTLEHPPPLPPLKVNRPCDIYWYSERPFCLWLPWGNSRGEMLQLPAPWPLTGGHSEGTGSHFLSCRVDGAFSGLYISAINVMAYFLFGFWKHSIQYNEVIYLGLLRVMVSISTLWSNHKAINYRNKVVMVCKWQALHIGIFLSRPPP